MGEKEVVFAKLVTNTATIYKPIASHYQYAGNNLFSK